MKAQDIIYEALRLLKIVRFPGQTASTVEQADGLIFLNNLVDSWSTERLLLPVVGIAPYSLVSGQSVYTIGPSGANLTGPRPLRIDSAGIVQQSYNSVSVSFRYPLKLIAETEYVAIRDKTASGDVPQVLYYAPAIPNGSLYLWPIPNVVSATQLELSAWTPLATFPDLTTDEPLAPGYARALAYNLAIEMGGQMEGATLTQETVNSAMEAKAYIMKLNSLMVPSAPDVATPPATSAAFEPIPSTLKAVAQAKFGSSQNAEPTPKG